MTNEDYEASGIKSFDKLLRLLKTRRETLELLCDMFYQAEDKLSARNAFINTRVLYDDAVLTMLKDIVDAYSGQNSYLVNYE